MVIINIRTDRIILNLGGEIMFNNTVKLTPLEYDILVKAMRDYINKKEARGEYMRPLKDEGLQIVEANENNRKLKLALAREIIYAVNDLRNYILEEEKRQSPTTDKLLTKLFEVQEKNKYLKP